MLTVTRFSPGVRQRAGKFMQQMAVSGNRQVQFGALDGAQPRQFAHQLGQIAAQQRFAARQPNLVDAKRDEYTRHAQIILARQLGKERALIARAAVDATIIAAVGDRDPQVRDLAAMLIGQNHKDQKTSIFGALTCMDACRHHLEAKNEPEGLGLIRSHLVNWRSGGKT